MALGTDLYVGVYKCWSFTVTAAMNHWLSLNEFSCFPFSYFLHQWNNETIIDTSFSCAILGCTGKNIAEVEGIFVLLITARHEYDLILKEVIIPEILARGTKTVPCVWIPNWWTHKDWSSSPQYLWQSISNLNTLPIIIYSVCCLFF